jgi:opacity protein-like surface antigen
VPSLASSSPRRGAASTRRALALAAFGALATQSVAREAAAQSELPAQFAYNYGETDTARSGGMSGALRAAGSAETAIFLNPANMGLSRIYHIDAIGQFTPEAGRHLYGGTIVDSTRRLAGGFGLIGGFQDGDGIDRSHIDVNAALSFAASDAFHIGLSGRYLSLQQEGRGVLGQSRASGGLVDPDDPAGRLGLVNAFTFGAGLTLVPVEGLHIGVSGQNLSYPNHGLLPTMVGGGIGYGTRDFTIEADGVADFSSWSEISPRVMVGGEYLLIDAIPLRLGYRFDNMSGSQLDPSHQLSGGVGYTDPRFALAASVRRTLVGPSATMIIAQLSLFLESFGLPIAE